MKNVPRTHPAVQGKTNRTTTRDGAHEYDARAANIVRKCQFGKRIDGMAVYKQCNVGRIRSRIISAVDYQVPLSTRLVSANVFWLVIAQFPDGMTMAGQQPRQRPRKTTDTYGTNPSFRARQNLSKGRRPRGSWQSRLHVRQQLQGNLVFGIRFQRFFVSRLCRY